MLPRKPSLRRRWPFGILLFIVTAASSGCSNELKSPGETLRRKRFLSVSANPRPEPPPTAQDFLDAIDLAYNAGARGQYLFYTWSKLEPQPSVYDFRELIDNINFTMSRGFQELLLTIAVVNTIPKETPSDLLGAAFNAPEMKARFHALLDALRPHLTSRVVYLSIGNEVDLYLAGHPNEWTAYKDFYDDARSYVHHILPWLKVGVTVTFDRATGSAASNVATLTASSDVYILTYYPLGPNFAPRGALSPSADFPRMLTLAGGRTVVLQEVGCPSSAVLASSEGEQAEFVSTTFQAWQAAGSKITFLNYFLLHDLTDQVCSELTSYYGLPPDPYFHAFLCSLGLRRVDGTAKPGWQALVDGAARIGLPD